MPPEAEAYCSTTKTLLADLVSPARKGDKNGSCEGAVRLSVVIAGALFSILLVCVCVCEHLIV